MADSGRNKMKTIKETDVIDKRNNVVISPGLKVRHKKSKFEYTVDSVVKDKSGKIIILLRKPEAPRFGSLSPKSPQTLTDRNVDKEVIYEAEPIEDFSTSYYSPEEESEDDLIAVPAKQFEKEYDL